MKFLKLWMLLPGLLIMAQACNVNDDTTRISGTVEGSASLHLLKLINNEPDTVKSLTIDGDNTDFDIPLEIDSLGIYFLFANEQFNIPLLISPGDKVQLDIDATTPQGSYEVSGSEESKRVKEVFDITADARKVVDSLSAELQNAQNSDNFAASRARLDSVYEHITTTAANRFRDMIDEDPQRMAHIFIFSQALGNRPLLSAEEDFEYFEKVAEGITESYPGLPITQQFNENIDQARQQMTQQRQMEEAREAKLAPGNEAPEIALPNPDGQTMSLSDLRGKVVLIDFWAAWCKPCRIENPNLVETYNNYKDQGFTVFSVSLDGLQQQQNPKEQWVAAIEQDDLTWDTHVSDLKGWNSQVVQQYGFNGIPFTVLIDKEGKIIETGLRGQQLRQKLAEIFEQG